MTLNEATEQLFKETNRIKKALSVNFLIVYTEDVQEVRRGKWEDPEDPTCYRCSACGKYVTQEYGLTKPIFWNYCPNCGAKMEDELNER